MNDNIKPYLQPAFVVCVAVLALAAGSKRVVLDWSGRQLTKLPIPLQKSLDEIDETKLTSYRVVDKAKIENPEVLKALGTDNYIQWIIEDTSVDESSPVRFCSLFITYYTGNPDKVPHVPEECFTGAGNQLLARDELALAVDVPDSAISGVDIKDGRIDFNVRHLVFSPKNVSVWQSASKFSVFYFFKVNGTFASSRDQTLWVLDKNIFGKYSYFSKVEWKFYGIRGGGIAYGTKDEQIKASGKLVSELLPVLESDHWPDWEKANTQDTVKD